MNQSFVSSNFFRWLHTYVDGHVVLQYYVNSAFLNRCFSEQNSFKAIVGDSYEANNDSQIVFYEYVKVLLLLAGKLIESSANLNNV